MGIEGHRHETAVKRLALILALLAGSAAAQPTGGTAKFQPTILNLQACIRANAPPAHLAGVRSYDEAHRYFHERCYARFASDLVALGAGDAAAGSFRHILAQEWSAFSQHLRSN